MMHGGHTEVRRLDGRIDNQTARTNTRDLTQEFMLTKYSRSTRSSCIVRLTRVVTKIVHSFFVSTVHNARNVEFRFIYRRENSHDTDDYQTMHEYLAHITSMHQIMKRKMCYVQFLLARNG